MSQANIPNITPNISISRDDAANLVLSSIAMEELGMSHILNAEGEKLQYVLGTLPGVSGPGATVSDILAVNNSVKDMVNAITKNEYVLQQKLEQMTCMPLSVGPTGPTGPTGPQGVTRGITGPQGPEGAEGPQGPRGPRGREPRPAQKGITGAQGATGPQGSRGLPGNSAIIPFSSNTPVEATALMNGEAGVTSFVGQGASATGGSIVGPIIDLSGAISNLAFSMPREGTITRFNALFSVSAIPAVSSGIITVHFQLFKSDGPSNTFELITEGEIDENLTLPITMGTIVDGSLDNLMVPVDARDRILLLVSITTSGIAAVTTLNGYVSAGLSIN